jgi:transposase
VTLDCTESYRECVASRKARVQAAIEAAEPGDTQAQIAERADVSVDTVQRMLQKTAPAVECNKPLKPEKLQRSDEIEARPLILELIRLINGCSALERRYLREVILPHYL